MTVSVNGIKTTLRKRKTKKVGDDDDKRLERIYPQSFVMFFSNLFLM